MPGLFRHEEIDTPMSPISSKTCSPPRPKSKKRALKRESMVQDAYFCPYSVPKLEEFIPMDNLPAVLMVYDRGNLTGLCPYPTRHEAVLYKRLYPKTVVRPTDTRRGCLFLDSNNVFAYGSRSTVLRAPIVAPFGSPESKRVSVIAKLPNDSCVAHHLLKQEAKAYSAFPDPFFHHTQRSNAPFTRHDSRPLPAMRRRREPADWPEAGSMASIFGNSYQQPPIAPRFYGYYVPIDDKGNPLNKSHRSRAEKDLGEHECSVPQWPRAILLMEDCGEPITVEAMDRDQREQCFDLVRRMHSQGFVHGAADPANMLVQPGPLHWPAQYRSLATPSFRLSSFGSWLERGIEQATQRPFLRNVVFDITVAKMGLGLYPGGEDEEGDDSLEDDELLESLDCEEVLGDVGGEETCSDGADEEDDGYDSDVTVRASSDVTAGDSSDAD